MQCPYCKKEMISGYVQSARKVFFTTNPHKIYFNPEEDEVVLTEKNWTAPTIPAYSCSKCKCVIIDYSKIVQV